MLDAAAGVEAILHDLTLARDLRDRSYLIARVSWHCVIGEGPGWRETGDRGGAGRTVRPWMKAPRPFMVDGNAVLSSTMAKGALFSRPTNHLGETGPLSQGVQVRRKARITRYINCMEVRKKRPRGFK